MRSMVRVLLVLIQVIVVLKHATANLDFSLECPFGWNVHGDVDYTPRSYEAYITKSASYFDSYLAICILCEFDMHVKPKWIEICAYRSYNALYVPLKYHLHPRVGKDFGSAQYQLTSQFAKVTYLLFFNVLYDTLVANPFRKIELKCPKKSHLIGLENRHSYCTANPQIRKTFCILCRSVDSEFSVCFNDCERIQEKIDFDQLVATSSTGNQTDDISSGKYCGLRLGRNDQMIILDEERSFNSTSLKENLIICDEKPQNQINNFENKSQSVGLSDSSNTFNTVYLGLMCAFVTIATLLLGVIWHLKRKLNSFTSKAEEDQSNVMDSSINSIDTTNTTQPDLQNDHTSRPAHQFSFNPYYP